MKYKAVCFDIDGTLYPRSVMNRRLLSLGFKHPFFAVKYNKMRQLYRELQSSFDCDSLFIDKSLMAREAIILQKNFGIYPNKDIDFVISKLNSCIYKPMEKLYSHTKSFDGVAKTFENLKAHGLKIGVFSDFPLFNKLDTMGLSKYVDFAASSSNVGFLKPNIHCFEYLLYNVGAKPSETLYVGDSYTKDVVGASNAGLNAVFVNAKEREVEKASSKYALACGVFASWKDFDAWLSEKLEVV